jgi:hypothetical protein
MQPAVVDGERLYPRSVETVSAFNERVGAEVLTWHAFRHAIAYGTKTRSGLRLRIPHVRFGRRIFTSLEAISRWAHAVAQADEQAIAPGTPTLGGLTTRVSATTAVPATERVAAAKRVLDTELG